MKRIFPYLSILTVAANAAFGAATVLREYAFSTTGAALPGHGCTTKVADGILEGTTTKKAHFMYLPECTLPSPLAVRLCVKTSPSLYDRGELYFRTVEHKRWGMEQMLRFALPHDDEWHELFLPLPTTQTLKQLRLSLGKGKGTFAIRWIRIEKDPYPNDLRDLRPIMPIVLENQTLRVEFDAGRKRFAVRVKPCGRVWHSQAPLVKALLTQAWKVDAHTMRLSFWDHASRVRYTCKVSLTEPGTLSFALDADPRERSFYALNTFPPALQCDMTKGRLVFCDRSSGVYAPLEDTIYGGTVLQVYGNTHCTDMPWMGVVDPETGDGMMALVETPFDALFLLLPDKQGRHWPQILWKESMDGFRYPRRFAYRFISSGGYVALAKIYRGIARKEGHVVPLRTKIERKPAVAFLPGAAVFWGASDVTDFLREARTEGILRGILSNAHHGLRDHEALRRLNELGYITSMYDSFSDALPGPTGHSRDPVAETALHHRPDAGAAQGWSDAMKTYFVRSSAFIRRAQEVYVLPELQQYGTNGRFVDVDMAVDPREDWHPRHTFDRRQDIAYRREAFAWLDKLNLILGTEHGNDWGIEFVEYTEGSLGGPFWWLQNTPGGWSSNPIRNAADPGEYRREYLTYGDSCANRIPLWQLVYHDCAVSTWYWADTPGIHFDARPDIARRKDLFTILYGGTPLLWRERRGYGWNRRRARFLQTVHDTTPWHQVVAFEELLDHAFLSPDKAVQRCRFSGSFTATVNFSDTPRTCKAADGHDRTLAPRGFLAEGPGILHACLWEDGEAVTQTEKDGFRRLVTQHRRTVGPITVAGEVLAFRVAPSRWQFVVEAAGKALLDLPAITGCHPPLIAYELDAFSRPRKQLPVPDPQRFSVSSEGVRRYLAVLPRQDADAVIAYPPGGDIDPQDSVALFTPTPDGIIYFTVNGPPPDMKATRYRHPFVPPYGATVRARCFVEGRPVGPIFHWDFRTVKTVYQSPILHGGDPPRSLDVPVQPGAQLRLLVGNGGDDCWSDWTAFGEPVFVCRNGDKIPLADMKPLAARQTYHELIRKTTKKPKIPLAIAGQSFVHGLITFSEAELLYPVPRQAVRFQSRIGVEQRGNPPGASLPHQTGTVTVTVQLVFPDADP